MLECYLSQNESKAVPVIFVQTDQFSAWRETQNDYLKRWINTCGFLALPETQCLVPEADGRLQQVIVGVQDKNYFWNGGQLPVTLPPGVYEFSAMKDAKLLQRAVMAWGLGAYQFTRYKAPKKKMAQLVLPKTIAEKEVRTFVETIYQIREWINMPTEHLGPEQLGDLASRVAEECHATLDQIIGDDLLKKNYPTIHLVGRASVTPPRLIDLRWGNPAHPKITLLGKGVCFDSGGLDIKNAGSMLLMKKDMAGAAHALGLARLIMMSQLPVCLRVLIPAVENAVSGNAFRPGDIVVTRKGISVEVGNTDAEGRLILCDAITEAVSENPELLLDFTTLTGAARVAVGTEISAFFSNHTPLAEHLMKHAEEENDPLCRLPLYAPYRKMLETPFADINNSSATGYAGAITAALFLKEFVPDTIPWAHFDFMAWNLDPKPGRPIGAEAMTIRGVFAYLLREYKKN